MGGGTQNMLAFEKGNSVGGTQKKLGELVFGVAGVFFVPSAWPSSAYSLQNWPTYIVDTTFRFHTDLISTHSISGLE